MQPSEILKKVRRLEITSKKIVDRGIAGSYHSVFRGRGMEFSEVREYQPGDDVRSIDWNVTARMGSPFVKIFVEERELTVAALVAFAAQRNNDRVGLLLATDRVERYIPPRRGEAHALQVLREILYFEPEGRSTNLAQSLAHFHNIHRRRAVVFVLSDFLEGNLEALARTARIVNQRHDVIAVRIRDALEERVPKAGLVEFEDPETGKIVLVDTASRAWRRAFTVEARAREEAFAGFLREAQVDHVVLRTGEPYWPPLARFMKERTRRRRAA
jgi:uncharacterized protein (DUF58 family)